MQTASDKLGYIQKLRKRALLASAGAGVLLLLFSEPAWTHWARRSIETAGLLLISICIIGRTLCAVYISGRKNAEIVEAGPYSVCRNPLYMFSLVGVAGIGLINGSFVLAALFAIVAWLIHRFAVDKEEHFLQAQYGQRYESYLRRVPRFVPDFSLWQNGEQIMVSSKGVISTFVDASLFLLAIPIAEALEFLKAAKIISTWLVLP